MTCAKPCMHLFLYAVTMKTSNDFWLKKIVKIQQERINELEKKCHDLEDNWLMGILKKEAEEEIRIEGEKKELQRMQSNLELVQSRLKEEMIKVRELENKLSTLKLFDQKQREISITGMTALVRELEVERDRVKIQLKEEKRVRGELEKECQYLQIQNSNLIMSILEKEAEEERKTEAELRKQILQQLCEPKDLVRL